MQNARDVVLGYPGFKHPPWKKINARKHIDLIAKLMLYWDEGPKMGIHDRSNLPYARAKAMKFIQSGGKLEIWRTRLLTGDTDHTRSLALPNKRTVVLMSLKGFAPYSFPTTCPKGVFDRWSHAFVVQSDLSGIDPDMDQAIAEELVHSAPVLDRGRLLLIYFSPAFTKNTQGTMCQTAFAQITIDEVASASPRLRWKCMIDHNLYTDRPKLPATGE